MILNRWRWDMIGEKIIACLIFFILLSISGCTEIQDDNANLDDVISEPVELDSTKVNSVFTKANEKVDAYWMRSGWFYWNMVEPEKDKFDWEASDHFIIDHLEKAECLLVVIFPYALWDQDTCHGNEYAAHFDKEKGGLMKVGKPCDMQEYKEYLEALVERYDGDGIDDMPSLKIPVKYWEICNEPSMQGQATGGMGEELKFFYGTSEEYAEVLKASYETIKEADPEAMVLHAGIAGMDQTFQDFWDPIYAIDDIGDYFDIANVHTISTTDRREDLFIDKYTKFLSKHGIENKSIWITELQIGDLTDVPKDTTDFDRLLVRSSVFSLALGADKLFHIVNWGKGVESETDKAYETLVNYLNSFDSLEILEQTYTEHESEYDGLSSIVGHYKFTKDGEVFYVLWGGTELPEEIMGTIKVTDVYGSSKTIDSTELTLTDDPVYVELVKLS